MYIYIYIGAIPEALSSLEHLVKLDLSDNQLTGIYIYTAISNSSYICMYIYI